MAEPGALESEGLRDKTDSSRASSDEFCDDDADDSDVSLDEFEPLCEADGCCNEAEQLYFEIPAKLKSRLWSAGSKTVFAGKDSAFLCLVCALHCCANAACGEPITQCTQHLVSKFRALPSGVHVPNDLDWTDDPVELCWKCAKPSKVVHNEERKASLVCSSLKCKTPTMKRK